MDESEIVGRAHLLQVVENRKLRWRRGIDAAAHMIEIVADQMVIGAASGTGRKACRPSLRKPSTSMPLPRIQVKPSASYKRMQHRKAQMRAHDRQAGRRKTFAKAAHDDIEIVPVESRPRQPVGDPVEQDFGNVGWVRARDLERGLGGELLKHLSLLRMEGQRRSGRGASLKRWRQQRSLSSPPRTLPAKMPQALTTFSPAMPSFANTLRVSMMRRQNGGNRRIVDRVMIGRDDRRIECAQSYRRSARTDFTALQAAYARASTEFRRHADHGRRPCRRAPRSARSAGATGFRGCRARSSCRRARRRECASG